MNNKKWHIKKDGTPGECNAKKRCPFGNTFEHFLNDFQAQRFVDYANEKGYDLQKEYGNELIWDFKEDELQFVLDNDENFKKDLEDFFEVDLDEPSFYESELRYNLMNLIDKVDYKDFLKDKKNLSKTKEDCRNKAISNLAENIFYFSVKHDIYGDEHDLFTQENIKFLFKVKNYNDIFLKDEEIENDTYCFFIEYVDDYYQNLDISEREICPVLNVLNKKSGHTTSRVIYNNNLTRKNFIENRVLNHDSKDLEEQDWYKIENHIFLVKEEKIEDFIKENSDNKEFLSKSLENISDENIKKDILEIIEESYDWEKLDPMSFGSLEPRYCPMTEEEKEEDIKKIYQDEWKQFYAEEIENKNPIFIKDFSNKLKENLEKQSFQRDGEKFYLF